MGGQSERGLSILCWNAVGTDVYYTTGELADIAGITYKSIRIYVEKGLLTPDKITESGYKLFSRRSVEKLQRILMFKYLDLTLEEIGQMLEYKNIQESLGKQLELIELKITHLNQIKKVVEDISTPVYQLPCT